MDSCDPCPRSSVRRAPVITPSPFGLASACTLLAGVLALQAAPLLPPAAAGHLDRAAWPP